MTGNNVGDVKIVTIKSGDVKITTLPTASRPVDEGDIITESKVISVDPKSAADLQAINRRLRGTERPLPGDTHNVRGDLAATVE